MTMSPGPALVEVTRRVIDSGEEIVESVHGGHVVIARPDGTVAAAVGDPAVTVFPRSAIKPFQAAAVLDLAGGGTDLTAAELAVAWASHSGQSEHLEAVGRLLRRSGTGADDLTCPPDHPRGNPGGGLARIHHNCSGKHALFALAGHRLGLRRESILDPTGPLQASVLRDLRSTVGEVRAIAVDGCGAPAVAISLSDLAAGFARAVTAVRFDRLRAAGREHPRLVSGPGRMVAALLGAGVFAKSGAEGVLAAGWITPAGDPVGLAVKASDGAHRCAEAVVHAVLLGAGVIGADVWVPQPPLGGGRPAGTVRVTPQLDGLLVTLT